MPWLGTTKQCIKRLGSRATGGDAKRLKTDAKRSADDDDEEGDPPATPRIASSFATIAPAAVSFGRIGSDDKGFADTVRTGAPLGSFPFFS